MLPSVLVYRTVTCGLAPLLYVLAMSHEFRNQVEVMMEDIKNIRNKWSYIVRNSSQLEDGEPSVVVTRIFSEPNQAEQNYDGHLPNQTCRRYGDVKDYLSRI